jgi:hypothetical protein
MKTKIILLSVLVLINVVAFGQMALAADPVLFISPATLNSTVGTSFNVVAQVNPLSNSVCAVRGTIVFNGLACQNITVASGLMAAIAPTCANPNFLIGIPKCTTAAQNIFSMSVRGNQAGPSSLAFSEVRIMGAGTGVSSIWNGGAYSITAVPATPETPVTSETPTEEIVTAEETQEVLTPAEQTTPENNIPTGVGVAGLSAITGSIYFWPLFSIFVILIIGYGIYYLIKKRKR